MKHRKQASCGSVRAGRGAGVAALLCAAACAHANDVTRNGVGTDLNVTGAWVEGVVPTALDVALFTAGSASGALSASTEWMGVRVAATTANRTVTATGFTLTLGSAGVDMSAAAFDFTIASNATSTLALGANQTWNIGAGRLFSNGGVTTGAATITKAGPGTLYMNNSLSTFTGGINVNEGVIQANSNTVVAADGTITSGSYGKGTLTFAGGTTITSNNASNRDFANNVVLNGDITVGVLGNTGRVRAAGTWDLGGQTRTITLTNPIAATATADQFGFANLGGASGVGGKTFRLSNGTLRFQAGATATAANPALIQFAVGAGGSFFDNNSGIILGNNVRAIENSNQTQGGTFSPSLTVEAGGQMLLTSGVTSKNLTVHSLSGAGLVSGAPTDTTQTVSTFTIDGDTGTLANFTGTIADNTGTVSGNQAGQVRLTKSAGGTQVLSGTSNYTGPTNVSAGVLQVDGALGNTPANLSGTGVLAGKGTLGGPVALTGTSSISPGSSVAGGPAIGTLTVGNSLTLGDTSAATFQINASTGVSDKVAGVTSLVYAGALNVTNIAGTLAAGQVYDLFDSASSSGAFATISLPSLPGGLVWHDYGGGSLFDYFTGQIKVEAGAVAVPGDYNGDGFVDSADYTVWADHFGQTGTGVAGDGNGDGKVDSADYTIWADHFGQGTPHGALVPEPGVMGAILPAVGLLARRRR